MFEPGDGPSSGCWNKDSSTTGRHDGSRMITQIPTCPDQWQVSVQTVLNPLAPALSPVTEQASADGAITGSADERKRPRITEAVERPALRARLSSGSTW